MGTVGPGGPGGGGGLPVHREDYPGSRRALGRCGGQCALRPGGRHAAGAGAGPCRPVGGLPGALRTGGGVPAGYGLPPGHRAEGALPAGAGPLPDVHCADAGMLPAVERGAPADQLRPGTGGGAVPGHGGLLPSGPGRRTAGEELVPRHRAAGHLLLRRRRGPGELHLVLHHRRRVAGGHLCRAAPGGPTSAPRC